MIRAAKDEDAEAIAAFWNPMIAETLVTFSTEQRSADVIRALRADKAAAGYGFYVFQDDATGAVEGFAYYGSFRAGPGYARVAEHTIILSPAAQGKGAGRALMAALEDHARGQGLHALVAGVSGGNPAGRAFHAAIGYREVGVMPEVGYKFGRYWDLVLMQKILN